MTRQLAKPQPLLARFGDAFVILSVTLLSLASGAWLITSFGLELTSAMLASLAIYGILLLLHLLVRRSFADTEDDDDELLYGDSHWQTAPAAEQFETALARSALNAPPRATGSRRRAAAAPFATGHLARTAADAGRHGFGCGSRRHLQPDPFTFRPSRSPYFTDDSDLDPYALGAGSRPRARVR